MSTPNLRHPVVQMLYGDRYYEDEGGTQKRGTYLAVVRQLRPVFAEMYLEAKTAGCACGERRLPAIDMHHVDPTTKRFNLSKPPVGVTPELYAEELAKCIAMCSNCHRCLHAKPAQDPLQR